jgi:RNA-directed DNA polymerase
MWRLTYKWARHGHPNKPRRWIVGQYFGKFNKFRNDHWVFGHRDSGGYLVKFAWTSIRRHVMVKGAASPTTPPWPATGQQTATRKAPAGRILRLLTRQDGQCPLCGEPLLAADQPPQSPQQ